MKKISICLLGIAMYACYAYCHVLYVHGAKTHDPKEASKEYYTLLETLEFHEGGHPYISVQVEDQTVISLLDLGFQGSCAFTEQVLDHLAHKQFLYTMTYCGVLGSAHPNKVYKLPKARLGTHDIIEPEAFEAAEDFFTAGVFFPAYNKTQKMRHSGSIGWWAFTNTNFFLDTENSIAGIADGITTLQKHGFDKHHFIKTPLLLDHGHIEIEVEGANGTLRCMLDTGSSVNLIHIECKGQEMLKQSIRERLVCNIDPKIGGESFDPITFIHFPILLNPPQVEAILGVDFFKKHVVFIDFAEKYVYLAKRLAPDHT